MKPVVLEVPTFNVDSDKAQENFNFARLCVRDCVERDEAPLASQLLCSQKGIFDDKTLEEIMLIGVDADLAWRRSADSAVCYINRGISNGMRLGIKNSIFNRQEFEYRRLGGYRNIMRPNLMTLTGPSGVGKTSIIKKFMEKVPGASLVVSLTSRSPRSSDLLGEYRCGVTQEYFEKYAYKFLWIIQVHGNTYGTLRADVLEALNNHGSLKLMNVVPESVVQLRSELKRLRNYTQKVLSFYVLSPNEDELRRRLTVRGQEYIERRIEECKSWERSALDSSIPYVFLTNTEPDSGIEKAAQQMMVFL